MPASNRAFLGSRDTRRASVACEQLILTSSPYVLSGGGFGPVAASSGWPYVLNNDSSGGLGKLIRFTDHPDAPHSLSVLRLPDGNRCFIHKAAAGTDAIGRSGRIVVHALLAPAETLHPRVALDLQESAFTTEWSQTRHSDAALPTVSVEAVTALPSKDHTARSDVLAAVLEHLEGGVGVTLQAAHPSKAALVLRQLFDLLPPSLTEELSYSTFEPDDKKCSLAICTVMSGPSKREPTADRRLVDLSEPPDLLRLRWTQLAEELISRYSAGITIPELATVAQLEEWVNRTRLLTLDPSTLDDKQVEQILDSDDAPTWLDNCGGPAQQRAVALARTVRGRRTADLLAAQLTAREKQVIADEALSGMVQSILNDRDVTADEYLVTKLTDRPPDVTRHIVGRAVDLLDRGRLTPRLANLVHRKYPTLGDDLDLRRRIAWLVVDRSPLQPDHSRDPWAFAFLVGHLAGWLDAPPALGPWLVADPDFVLSAISTCAAGVVGPGGARPAAYTTLKVLANVTADYRHVALEVALRSRELPQRDTIRRLSTKGPATDEDMTRTPPLWPLFGKLLGLDEDYVNSFELRPKPRPGPGPLARRWLPWIRAHRDSSRAEEPDHSD